MRAEETVGALIVVLVVFSIGASLAAPALAPQPTQREVRELARLVRWIVGNVTFAPNETYLPAAAGEWRIELDPGEAAELTLEVGLGEVTFSQGGEGSEDVVIEVSGTGLRRDVDGISVGTGEVVVYLPPGFSFERLEVDVGMGDVSGTIPLAASGHSSVRVGVGQVRVELRPGGPDGTVSIRISGAGSARAEGFSSVSKVRGRTEAILGTGQGFTLEVRLGTGDAEVRVAGP